MKNPNNEKPESENVDPSMRTAAWYRGVISLLLCVGAITAFVYGNVQISHGCMDRMLGDFMIAFVAVPVLLVDFSGIQTGAYGEH